MINRKEIEYFKYWLFGVFFRNDLCMLIKTKLLANYFGKKKFDFTITSIDFKTVNIYVVKMERKTKTPRSGNIHCAALIFHFNDFLHLNEN